MIAVETFGERLRRMRVEQGFSQRELAELSGVSNAYLSRLEKDERSASVKMIRKLSIPLRVSPSFLELGVEHDDLAAITQALRDRLDFQTRAVEDALAMLEDLPDTPIVQEIRDVLIEGRLGRA